MNDTYITERHEINQKQKTIVDLKKEWLFLVDEVTMFDPFDTHIESKSTECSKNNIEKQGKKVYEYLKIESGSGDLENVLNEIEQMKDQIRNPEIIGILILLLTYFKEVSEAQFREYKIKIKFAIQKFINIFLFYIFIF